MCKILTTYFTKNEILNTINNPEGFGILENEIAFYKK